VRRITEPVRHVVHYGRRLRGYAQLHGLDASGEAPAAVRAALQRAIRGRPSAEESEWITQIERLRALLASSPQALEIVDYGASPGHRYDTGEPDPVNIATRTLGDMTRSSILPRWAYLLLRLIRELRPGSVLEMGSCVGISACYQAAALDLNRTGRLLTLEGAPVLAARSARSIEELALAHRASVIEGRFQDTLDDVLGELKPIEMAFIDADHLEAPTLDYTERILAAAAEEAVLVFDDIHWSPGMTSAWSTIAADPRFALTLDLRVLGIAVVSESAHLRSSRVVSYA
jgi:predicted O-methyltransferase YrrM